MSFQWTFIAGYLYLETAIVVVMLLPIFSPRQWHVFFRSRMITAIREHAAVYFYVILGLLSLFLIDSIREMNKYSHTTNTHLTVEMKGNVKMFRAQRNFYITGFAIFLTFVIRRIVTMLIIQDTLAQKAERIIKDAESTVELAKRSLTTSSMHSAEMKNYIDLKQVLDVKEEMLKEEKIRVKDLEAELANWKLKIDELTAQSIGKGDE